jgi:DNA modification methylase
MDQNSDYLNFLRKKVVKPSTFGFQVQDSDINPILKPHQKAIVRWMVEGGRRACFAAFGLGKSIIQLETVRLTRKHAGGMGLIVIPLGVRQEFTRDARMIGTPIKFIRRVEEAEDPQGIYLTNYETIRDGKMDPREFTVASLDEASCLRGFGGTKTFREFMRLFAGDGKRLNERIRSNGVPYRFVATATPSPNDFIELLAYAAYLDIMDVSAAKTRFFKRDSTKADHLTIHEHKKTEFWLWIASWALFVQKPSDLGFDDTGYDLPSMTVNWHEVPTDHSKAGVEKNGQARMFANAALGVQDACREKRNSMAARVAKAKEIVEASDGEHFILWHDLEDERHAIQKAIPEAVSVWGTQDLEEREDRIIGFSNGDFRILSTKPLIAGSGCNFQRHCHRAIFTGIGFKFNDFIQATHRVFRFLQDKPVTIDIIYTSAERRVRKILEKKWTQHNEMVEKMTEIIQEYGLSMAAMAEHLTRAMGVERVEISGKNYRLINNDAVIETRTMEESSVGLILTSIPFSTQYEYSPNYADFGHSDTNAHFWQQMDFLIPELLRVLQPGRIAAIHVKDRIVPGGMTGLGFQTVYPFHMDCHAHFVKHGFGYMGMKTIVTDVVRENNQTYRLGWTEQCKDGTKMGVGMPEYLLIFRKPPTDTSNGYADLSVVKSKEKYSRSRWQIDAHGFTRSSGNRLLDPDELKQLSHEQIFKLFRDYSLSGIYNFEHHVKIGEWLDAMGRLPVTFMLLQPQSWSPEVWTDITRMLTLNGSQSAKGKVMHLCLARDSLVLTKERGYTPIQNVNVGEHTLTHMGRWRKVLVVKNTGVRRTITLKAQGVPGLTLTPDHELWARKSDWARERDGAERVGPRWIEAQDTMGGYVNLKVPYCEPQCEEDLTTWWLVGRWLADGHIDRRGSAIVSCGKEKWDHFLAMIGPYGGNTPHIGTAIQLQIHDPKRKLRSILERCGSGAMGKHVPPEAFTLPTSQARALVDGYLSGDGHFIAERNRWQACSCSRELLMGLSVLIQRIYDTIPSISAGRCEREHVIDGRVVYANQEWNMSFDLPGNSRKQPFILDDGAWKKVRSIEDAGEVETWCLKVEEDESFTAEGCIVKNCPMQFDLADRAIEQWSMPGEIVFDPFGGLMTVPYRAVLKGRYGLGVELSPQYFLDGCGYCKAAEQQKQMPTIQDLIENVIHHPELSKAANAE